MDVKRWIGIVMTAFAVGCGGDTAKSKRAAVDASKPTTLSQDDLAKHNKAVAHMMRNEVAAAEKILIELSEKHPNSEPLAVDRAIAGMHRIRGGAQGVPLFEDAFKRFPDSIRARYGLAYIYSINGKIKEAATLLEPLAVKVEAGELRDPHIAYRIGKVQEDLSDPAKTAHKWFRKAYELDPHFYTAAYRVWASFDTTDRKSPEFKALLEIYKGLEHFPHATVADEKIRKMGPLLDVVPYENRLAEASPAPPPQGPLFLDPAPLLTKEEWGSAKPTARSSMTVCDIDGDGRLDVFIADANVTVGGRTVANAVLLQHEEKKFRLAVDHPMAEIPNVTAVLWGDVDNDGLTDAFLCRSDGNQVWRQTSKGKWQKKDTATGPNTHCNGGVLLDADYDGDLDVFLVYESAPNELLQNDGSGSFKAMGKELGVGVGKGAKFAAVVDLDADRMPELMSLSADGDARYLSSDVKGGYKETQQIEGKSTTPVLLAVATHETSAKVVPERIEFADVDGSGKLSAFSSWNGRIHRHDSKWNLDVDAAAWCFANFDAKRGPSLVCLPRDGSPPVAAHPGPGRHDYFSMSFIGDRDGQKTVHKSNRSGIGVRIAMRIGDVWVKQFPLGQCSGPGQSLQPIAVGSRGVGNADFLFIDWSNGDFQAEFSPPLGKTIAIKELDRMPVDSCPLLFVWNGRKYEFVTDFLGVGGVDYLVRPGEYYTPTDPVENLLLPQGVVVADGGKIKLKVLEPAEEITFLDRAALVAYELPPGWEMTLDERHSALPPKVTHEPRFFRNIQTPMRTVNETGLDCTAAIRDADFKAAASPKADVKFVGRFERPHQLTMDFAKPIAETRANPMLLIDGWVAFPDAQAVVNASQSAVEFSAPKLEAMGADGNWSVVYPEFGYPAGMQRQSSLPLTRLPNGCRKLRITHELEAYWDRIALVDVQPCPEVRRIELKMESASLSAVGSPRYDRDRDGKPFWFDYDDRNPFWPARTPEGKYTRFGDCKELVATDDDASATIGPGEEVHLEFAAPQEPPKNWTRRYVLESRGWCRGMRIYTRNGATVEPMPHTNLPTERRDELHRKFNTRVVGRALPAE